MHKVRAIAKISENRIDIDETKIDLFDIPQSEIPDWEPSLHLPEFSTVPCLYLDIETYTNNDLLLDYFARVALSNAPIHWKDKKLVDFVISQLSDKVLKEYLLWRVDRKKNYSWTFEGNDNKEYRTRLHDEILSLKSLAKSLPLIDEKGALDANKGEIILIGLMNEKGKPYIIDCREKGEANGIALLFHLIDRIKPKFLAHYNGFDFDLPFIQRRAEIYGIESPFWVSPNPTVFRSAQMFGKPVEYNAFWYKYGIVAIVDLYHHALAWDFVNRKLTEFSLKKVPLQLGLRKEERLVLTFQEICSEIESGDLTRLKQYLVYDLEDSLLMGNFLLPDIYYQKEILEDWNFQSIATGGFGTKWDDKLCKEYRKIEPDKETPTPGSTMSFEGGLVGAVAGLFRNVSKIDVASLYPTIMLLYLVHSIKDDKMLLLRILKYLKVKRLAFKDIATTKKGTSEGFVAKQRQGALKVMINSAYGALGVTNKPYNDYLAATTVTAYGRAILRLMIKSLEDVGAKCFNFDTDGVYFTTGTHEKNKKAHEYCQSKMPGNDFERVSLEYELEALAMYIPPAVNTKEETELDGLKKNYIIINSDGSIKANGKFRKRDKCVLEKTFTPDLVKNFLEGTHKALYKNVVKSLLDKSYPVDNLSVTRKIKANEKRLVELGLGLPGEVVTIWKGIDEPIYSAKTGKPLKKVNVVWTDNPDNIDWQFYITMVNDMFVEFVETPKH